MRHVDDGTLHAWLDAELPAAGAGAVASHLDACAACRARLDEARTLREQTGTLLALGAPAIEQPPFDRLVAAAAARDAGTADEAAIAASVGSWRRPLLAAGWAASVACAVAVGWAARDLVQPAGQPAQVVAMAADVRAGTERPERPVAAREPDVPAGAGLAEEPQHRESLARQVSAPPAQASGAAGPAAAAAERGRPEASQPADASGASPADAAPGVDQEQAVTDATPAAAQAAGEDAGTTQARPRTLEAPAPSPSPPPGVTTLTADSLALPLEAPADPRRPLTFVGPPPAIVWQPVPRTEAAVRAGMALYGIVGLDAVETAISSDGLQVRTRYRLESGDAVVLVQQRNVPPPTPGVVSDTAVPVPQQPSVARSVLRAAESSREWTAVRGDMRVTLGVETGTPALAELGARLQIE